MNIYFISNCQAISETHRCWHCQQERLMPGLKFHFLVFPSEWTLNVFFKHYSRHLKSILSLWKKISQTHLNIFWPHFGIHGWNVFCWAEEARLKRPHIMLFQSYHGRKRQNWGMENNVCQFWRKWWLTMKGSTGEFLRYWNCSGRY